ncbi:MAG: hypothetical protein J5503_07505 [Muribaculaceae bacterium]|nr:hypothetical protein [Muribaculaceae bacterium]
MQSSNHMSSPGSRRWHDAAYWGLMLAACIVFYVLNLWTSFKEDDMEFSLLRDAGFMDFVHARYDHYLTANGRCSDFFATLFCAYLGKPLFNICNTLVFALMAHLVSLLSAGRRSALTLALFIAFVALCFPVPGQTMLFVAGSCNYMWAITASLSVILLLRHLSSRPHPGKIRTILLVLLAFTAANFNEATSFGFFGGMVLYYLFNRKELNRTVVLVLLAYLAGALLIMGSPAAWNRVQSGGIALNMSLPRLLASRSYIFVGKMVSSVMPVLAFLTGVVVLLRKGLRPIRECLWAYILFCLALVMFVLGYINDRAYAPLATVAFIIVATAVEKLLSRGRWASGLRMAVITGCIILSIVGFAHGLKTLGALKTFEDKVSNEIVAAPRQAVLHECRFDGDASRFIVPLSYVSSDYFVRENTYCAFYDKDNVQFVSDSVFARYYEGRLLDGAVEMPITSDRPDFVSSVLRVPGQDYMVVTLKVDTMPFTSQQATYKLKPASSTLSQEDVNYRLKYGLATDNIQLGFYPLRFEDRTVLVFPSIDDNVASVSFPIDFNGETQVTLTPGQPVEQ